MPTQTNVLNDTHEEEPTEEVYEMSEGNLDTPSPAPQEEEPQRKQRETRNESPDIVEKHVAINMFETRKDKIYNPFEDKIYDAYIPVDDTIHQAKASASSQHQQVQQQSAAVEYNFKYGNYSQRKRGSIEDLDYRIMRTGYGRGADGQGFEVAQEIAQQRYSAKERRAQSTAHAPQIVKVPSELRNSPYLPKRNNSGGRSKKSTPPDFYPDD